MLSQVSTTSRYFGFISNNFLTILRQNFLLHKKLVIGLVAMEKKRKFISKILADSVFLEGKKKDHVF